MQRPLYIASLIVIDLLGFYFSFITAYATRLLLTHVVPSLPTLIMSAEFFLRQWWIPLVLVLVFAYEGLYSKRLIFWMEAKTVVQSVLISAVAILAIITLSKMTDEVSRLFVLLLFVYAVFLIPLCRLFFKNLLHCQNIGIEKIIVIGEGERAVRLAKVFDSDRYMGLRVVCLLGSRLDRVSINGREVKIYRGIKWLKRLSMTLGVSTVVLTSGQEEIKGLIPVVQRAVKNIYIAPDIEGIGLLNTELIPLVEEDIPLLLVRNNLKDPINMAIKVCFDIALAVLVLPLLLPTLVVISVLIKLDSKGPVLFTQKRVGRGGVEFRLYKFRTMYVDSDRILEQYLKTNEAARGEYEKYCKLRDDPRVTRIGRLLRKCSLDELPQIFNILKGDMSFVGPRPAFKGEIEQYYGVLAYSYIQVKPGITGLWQVSGRNRLTMKERARLESFYVTNWSLWLDIMIILKTVKVVLKTEGAY
jgi:undecaprenyl-phosphate galactose phosphotransferase